MMKVYAVHMTDYMDDDMSSDLYGEVTGVYSSPEAAMNAIAPDLEWGYTPTIGWYSLPGDAIPGWLITEHDLDGKGA